MATDQERGLRIGEVAKRIGVNSKTIRYYEDIGLLPEPARLPSGYRVYGDEAATPARYCHLLERDGG